MTNKRMLVDATHAEEVRVAILQDQLLTNLEIETSAKEQIKGNVYLGRVTRVEPSLQAAFIDFNGGRQGFLSVNDIHPKYYPAPEGEEREPPPPPPPPPAASEESAPEEEQPPAGEDDEDEFSVAERRPTVRHRSLPIQKILSRNQVLLVQVVKEARGGKGASLTTLISLPGRYTVCLPENSGGGGISRKIIDPEERKYLKEVMASLEIPPYMSLIIRTAGLGRNKREITRDMNYILRLWKKIQEKAAVAKAPVLIHEEGDLIMRTIRDLYSTDMEEILIEGQEGYRRGKEFMRLLMPRYVKVVQPYKDRRSLFSHFMIEDQIESMHERVIRLKSGGYLVIDHTEAMVTVDINSGRATREKSVENTAFKINMESVDEIARQLRLRDLGGLIVIDFIDMEDKRHNLEVEKRMKEALKQDRSKIQMGKISQFGILELSRQRLKPTFHETSRLECPRCHGVGTIRSVESSAIHIFRCIEEDADSARYSHLVYHTPLDVANYLLNHKRNALTTLEELNKVVITIQGNPDLQTPDFKKERTEHPKAEREKLEKARAERERQEKESIAQEVSSDEELEDDDKLLEDPESGEGTVIEAAPDKSPGKSTGQDAAGEEGDQSTPETTTPSEETPPRRRRRRRRRRRSGAAQANVNDATTTSTTEESDESGDEGDESDESDEADEADEKENSPPPPPVVMPPARTAPSRNRRAPSANRRPPRDNAVAPQSVGENGAPPPAEGEPGTVETAEAVDAATGTEAPPPVRRPPRRRRRPANRPPAEPKEGAATEKEESAPRQDSPDDDIPF